MARRRKSRIPGTDATESYAVPVCSSCRSSEHMRRDDQGNWACMQCADEWLREYVRNRVGSKSVGGVELPWGVTDGRRVDPSFRDLMPNRATRRAMKGR